VNVISIHQSSYPRLSSKDQAKNPSGFASMAIRGTIALKPKKKQHMSTMGSGHHIKVTTGGTISTARRVISSICLP